LIIGFKNDALYVTIQSSGKVAFAEVVCGTSR
jgi:hypothetical protein